MNSNKIIESLKKILVINEQIEKKVENQIVPLFRFLNIEKKKHKTRKSLLEAIKELQNYLSIPQGYELYLLELYLLNYRADGNYSDLRKGNFVDPRKSKGKVTANTKSNLYTKAKLPFKGSNLEGYWSEDSKGIPYYVVNSYRWYPIFIFKEDKWYEVTDSYSSSTGRQISNSMPIKYNEDIDSEVFLLTRSEMKMLERGANHEEIIKGKLEKFKSKESELLNKRVTNISDYGSPIKIKFKISSIEDKGNEFLVNVDIYDVLKREGNKGVPTTQNYLKGEINNVTPEKVEKNIERKLKYDLKEFLGSRHSYMENIKPSSLIKFKFNHLRK